ncbi:MAG: glycosyltransferase, partial [Bacilli bacterium]
MKISYVIPCYNSQNTIELVINDINEAMSLEKIVSSDFEIICVDDGSHDQTIEVLKTISNQF